MAEARQQMEQGRENLRQASEALEKGQISQAVTEGARAGRELNDLREDLRKKSSDRFGEEMTEMREQARRLDEKQGQLTEQLEAKERQAQRSLRDPTTAAAIHQGLEDQQKQLDQLHEPDAPDRPGGRGDRAAPGPRALRHRQEGDRARAIPKDLEGGRAAGRLRHQRGSRPLRPQGRSGAWPAPRRRRKGRQERPRRRDRRPQASPGRARRPRQPGQPGPRPGRRPEPQWPASPRPGAATSAGRTRSARTARRTRPAG